MAGGLATALFAVSDRLVWHATEAKPYAVDVFVAVLAAWGYVRIRDFPLRVQCALWLAILPVAERLCVPRLLRGRGPAPGLLLAARAASWPDRLAYVVLGLAVVGSFVARRSGRRRPSRTGR